MTIAMVGASDPQTFDDQMRLDVARQHGWLGEYRQADLDLIDLGRGRDFLQEKKRYAAVVVHSVFHTRPEFMKAARTAQQMDQGLKTSPKHTVENWRRRLMATGAKTIIVWELLPFALSGWHLNELNGYRIAHRDHRVTVYKRKEEK